MSTGTKITPAANTSGSAKIIIAALILSAVGIAGSSHLLLSQAIGSGEFVTLVLVSVILGLIIFFGDRVSSFSLKDMSVTLAKIEEARIEVEAKRSEIEELAYLTVRLVAISQEAQRTFGMTDGVEAEFKSVSRDILRLAGIPKSDSIFGRVGAINRESE
jgi:hypothetical protein